ncbi:5-formyltetrahydrofolate cyclo-ligase [Buchnera aphidicola]|uniref:5-formyltetrahydrofolate cyclo-ligase n=1 Tax=Buchnera aphidicola TaxID=9 RepID=UPI0031B71FF7
MNNQIIRENIRIKRKKLSEVDRNNAAIKVANLACNFKKIKSAKNIALFSSFDGEISTLPLINILWKKNTQVFLPKIQSFSKKTVFFLKYKKNTVLKVNRFNISEPIAKNETKNFIDEIEIILVPLVAFNSKGYRLGMGCGFYDFLLKDWKKKKFIPVGIAYNFQLVKKIKINSWDIPLPYIITPKKIWFWKKNFF